MKDFTSFEKLRDRWQQHANENPPPIERKHTLEMCADALDAVIRAEKAAAPVEGNDARALRKALRWALNCSAHFTELGGAKYCVHCNYEGKLYHEDYAVHTDECPYSAALALLSQTRPLLKKPPVSYMGMTDEELEQASANQAGGAILKYVDINNEIARRRRIKLANVSELVKRRIEDCTEKAAASVEGNDALALRKAGTRSDG